jgi:hypothetical protein
MSACSTSLRAPPHQAILFVVFLAIFLAQLLAITCYNGPGKLPISDPGRVRMASRAEKVRRRQHRKDKKRRPGQRLFPPPGEVCVINAPGEVNMSEVVLEFIHPERDLLQNEEDFRLVLSLGVAAWNIALEQPEERAALLQELAAGFPDDARPRIEAVVQAYISRKERRFAHLQRLILDFDLSWQSGRPHLRVLSGPDMSA